MPRTEKKGRVAGVIATTKEVVQQREATLCSKIREASADLEETEVATRTQEGTENPMEQMEEHHKDKDSQAGAKGDQTNILTAKWH